MLKNHESVLLETRCLQEVTLSCSIAFYDIFFWKMIRYIIFLNILVPIIISFLSFGST